MIPCSCKLPYVAFAIVMSCHPGDAKDKGTAGKTLLPIAAGYDQAGEPDSARRRVRVRVRLVGLAP
jgi:hypothetical protein